MSTVAPKTASPKVKIKLHTSLGGNHLDAGGKVRGTFVHNVGTILDWDAREAAVMVERGMASYVEAPK